MTGIAAYGTLLAIGDSNNQATAVYTTVAQVTNIGGPGMSLDTIDVTDHQSTGAWEEVVAGILRSGEVSMDLNFDPALATHANASGGLLYEMVQRTSKAYRITFPDASVWTFEAYVTAFNPSADHAGKLSASVTLKLTGVPTLV